MVHSNFYFFWPPFSFNYLRRHYRPALRAVRVERRQVEKDLRALLTKKAAFMSQKNFAERAQIVNRLGRECIPVKAGAQSEMDGVVLGASGSGATVFKEPAEAVPLNNRLLELAAAEEAEVEAVLRSLTLLTMGNDGGGALMRAVEALGKLDLAAARAGHAAWQGHVHVSARHVSLGVLPRVARVFPRVTLPYAVL